MQEYVIADKSYDSQSIVEAVLRMEAKSVIPSKSFRKKTVTMPATYLDSEALWSVRLKS